MHEITNDSFVAMVYYGKLKPRKNQCKILCPLKRDIAIEKLIINNEQNFQLLTYRLDRFASNFEHPSLAQYVN